MPIKSKAQRRKFAQLLVEGKITDEAYERWNREAGDKELPERVAQKAKSKSKPKAKPKPKARPRKAAKPRTAKRQSRRKSK